MNYQMTASQIIDLSRDGKIVDVMGTPVRFHREGSQASNGMDTFTWDDVRELLEAYSTATQLVFNY